MKIYSLLICATILLINTVTSYAKETLFANGDLSNWEEQFFDAIPKHTQYQIIADPSNPTNSNLVLEAKANASGSGFILQEKLPFSQDAKLAITYQVVSASNSQDEKTKAGDDFPLRIYLTAKNFLFYTTLVLVHSSQYPSDSNWLSAYSGNVAKFHMYVIKGNEVPIATWEEVEVPVGKIWLEIFGELPDEIDAFSMMVDSDNAMGEMHTKIAQINYSW